MAQGNKGIKKLKFKPHLVGQVLDGTKTITWRLFDDKNLQKGDHLELINSDSGEKFADAEITGIQEKKVGDLTLDDLRQNNYQDRAQVIQINRKYYGDSVDDGTIVKIVEFKRNIGRDDQSR